MRGTRYNSRDDGPRHVWTVYSVRFSLEEFVAYFSKGGDEPRPVWTSLTIRRTQAGTKLSLSERVCVYYYLQYLIQSCARGVRRIVDYSAYYKAV